MNHNWFRYGSCLTAKCHFCFGPCIVFISTAQIYNGNKTTIYTRTCSVRRPLTSCNDKVIWAYVAVTHVVTTSMSSSLRLSPRGRYARRHYDERALCRANIPKWPPSYLTARGNESIGWLYKCRLVPQIGRRRLYFDERS